MNDYFAHLIKVKHISLHTVLCNVYVVFPFSPGFFLFKYILYFILFVFSPKTLKYKISLVLSQATVTNSTTVNGANILSRTGGFYNEPFQGVKYKGGGHR